MATASLREKLEMMIKNIPENEVTLREIFDSFGNESLMLLIIFLSLVFLIPVSIPGVSTVFGTAILLVGISMLFNRQLWLPKKIAHRPISSEKLTTVMERALVFFRRVERFVRPNRFHWMIKDGKTELFNKLSLILATLLLMVPFGFIPFSNTLPALAILFLTVGMLEKDGGSIFVGHLIILLTIIYFVALMMGGGFTIYEVFRLFSS